MKILHVASEMTPFAKTGGLADVVGSLPGAVQRLGHDVGGHSLADTAEIDGCDFETDVRFDKHMAGIQAGRYVQAYGLRLLPELYEAYNPMPYDAAREMEVELGIALREAGYGVWQA